MQCMHHQGFLEDPLLNGLMNFLLMPFDFSLALLKVRPVFIIYIVHKMIRRSQILVFVHL
jgi:hypothetical protein